MIIEIALGIVLAVLILLFLPLIIEIGLALLAIAVVICIGVMAYVFIPAMPPGEARELMIICAVGVVGWVVLSYAYAKTQEQVKAQELTKSDLPEPEWDGEKRWDMSTRNAIIHVIVFWIVLGGIIYATS